MALIDGSLIKEIRNTADWFLALPSKIIGAYFAPQQTYYVRRERIRKLKEIVEVREIAKELQELFLMKGSAVHYVRELQADPDPQSAKHLREFLLEVAAGISRVKEAVADISTSNIVLASEGPMFLARADAAYRKLAALPDDVLLNDDAIQQIVGQLENIMKAGGELIQKLDEHRRELDASFGDHDEKESST